VRGDYNRSEHAWNVVTLYEVEWLCDVMFQPVVLHKEGSEQAELYKRLPQRGGQDTGGGAGRAW